MRNAIFSRSNKDFRRQRKLIKPDCGRWIYSVSQGTDRFTGKMIS